MTYITSSSLDQSDTYSSVSLGGLYSSSYWVQYSLVKLCSSGLYSAGSLGPSDIHSLVKLSSSDFYSLVKLCSSDFYSAGSLGPPDNNFLFSPPTTNITV